jgi:hypothetical protein
MENAGVVYSCLDLHVTADNPLKGMLSGECTSDISKPFVSLRWSSTSLYAKVTNSSGLYMLSLDHTFCVQRFSPCSGDA